MKSYLVKMTCVILIISSFINIYKNEHNKEYKLESIVANSVIFESSVLYNRYEEESLIISKVVYEDLSLEELSAKLNRVLNSTLAGKGKSIATLALDNGVDPVVATSIILVETGCKWTCSSLVRNSNNVGGMRGRNGYMRFNTLEEGLSAFIGNLARNYYQQGLTTPETMNRKYAANPNWHNDVNYYVKLIKAS